MDAEPARRAAPAGVLIREARAEDLPAIQAIYAHHVRHGVASFEETPPDLAEMIRRFETTRAGGYPYLAAARGPAGGAVVGYAYAGPYRPRPAYRYTVENSVYLAPEAQGRGIGRALLEALIADCAARGFRQMVAIISDSDRRASIRLHESLGFRRVGDLRAVGFKFGRWVDTVLMQRPLDEADGAPPAQG